MSRPLGSRDKVKRKTPDRSAQRGPRVPDEERIRTAIGIYLTKREAELLRQRLPDPRAISPAVRELIQRHIIYPHVARAA